MDDSALGSRTSCLDYVRPRRFRSRVRSVTVTFVIGVLTGSCLAACDSGDAPKTDAPKTSFETEASRVGNSLRIHWSVTNTADKPILAFDRIPPDDGIYDPHTHNGAYIISRSDGTVEIAMRAFPVPEDTEGAVPYDFTTTRLAPGASTSGDFIVLLPLRYRPAAAVPEGGAPLPDNPKRAVFCLGVITADNKLIGQAKDPTHPVLPHNRQIADTQTLLCGGPIALDG